MTLVWCILGLALAYIIYLMGYCAGSCDKQKELANKFSLTK